MSQPPVNNGPTESPPPIPPPPPPPPPPAAAAYRPGRKVALTAGIILTGIAAVVVVLVLMKPPADEEIWKFVQASLEPHMPPEARAESLRVISRSQEGAAFRLNIDVSVSRPPAARLVPVVFSRESADVLARQAPEANWQALLRARQMARGPRADRLRTLAGLTLDDDACIDARFAREEKETYGFSANVLATVTGELRGFSWKLKFTPDRPASLDLRSRLQISPGTADSRQFVINRPADLPSLLEFSRRIEGICDRLERALPALAAELKSGALRRLGPGSFFAGTAKPGHGSTGDDPAEIYLEVTELRANGEVPKLTAVVRNDGSWGHARVFSGALHHAADDAAFVLRLESPASQAIGGAGPLVGGHIHHQGNWHEGFHGITVVELNLTDDGLAWEGAGASIRLKPADPDAREGIRSRMQARDLALIEATAPGRLYAGRATERRTGEIVEWLLHFDKREPDSIADVRGGEQADPTRMKLHATLDRRAQDAGVLPFGGRLDTNLRRAGRAPIELDYLAEGARYPGRSSRSAGNHKEPEIAEISLRLDGDRLVGETPRHVFRFEPAPPALVEERRRLAGERLRAAEEGLLRIVRIGASYEGRAEGFPELSVPVHLRFNRVEGRGESVEVRLTLGTQTEPFDILGGRLDVPNRVVNLSRTNESSRQRLDRAHRGNWPPFIIFWLNSDRAGFQLQIEADSLVLKQGGGPGDRFVFPLQPAGEGR